jgi:serine/threonine-protein kinase
MVYQVLKEWGEEVKCLELAVRRYSKHPLSHRIIDHIIFRLHEASSHERLAAYHLALLALMHLRYLFTSHDHKQIIDQIQKQWTHLPFFSVDLPEGQLAFLLSKKFILLELIDTQKEPEDAFFALLELGHKEDIQSHSSLDLYPSVKSGLEPLSLNLKTVSYHPLLCHYLFYFYFERGLLEPLLELPLNPILQFTLLIALRQLDEAHELLKTFSLTEQTREDSPLFVLIGCYLWALEGEDIAKAHFNGVEVMLYPPCTTLLAYEIMGKLDSNRWLQEALFWEKLSLYRQQLLLAYCLNQKEEVLKLQTIIQKLRDHS